ncbi:MAG: hypothetical protein N3A65_06980 [candidate division WOR-3 bacterium]|nr:hypothetical protein [candidate division WOR-3 bacterium]
MRLVRLLLILCITGMIFAHKINIFATVEGDRIYTQSYASDGSKIKGGLIEVYDKNGNKLLTGKTDSLGEFSFLIPERDDLRIVVTGGMGHRAEAVISADELPQVKKEPGAKQRQEKKSECGKESITPAIDTASLRIMIEEAIDTRIQTVIRMLVEQKKKDVGYVEIIGGIGYIVGIIGIIAFFMGRKKNV